MTVTVNAQDVIRIVPNHFLGINAAIWDDAFTTSATNEVLSKMQVRMLRFPGGSASDEYHWGTNRSEGQSFPWAVDFNTFWRTASAIDAEVVITVNYGTGSAEEAAGWVEAANVNTQRNIRYWEIGNEVYGSWETDRHARPHDPRVYAEEAVDYITRMKRADPSIRVGIAIAPGEDSFLNYEELEVTNPRTGVIHRGWSPLVLARMKELGKLPDFVSYHRYEFAPFDESDPELLNRASRWKNDIAALRQMIDDYTGAGNAIEIMCTELNSVSSRPGKQTTSLVNGLYLADSLGQALQTEVGTAIWWNLRNAKEFGNNNSPGLYGWRIYGDYGVMSHENERYPTSYAMELFGNFARPGDAVLNTSSSSAVISAYAVRHENTISLLMINKSSDQAFDIIVKFNGFNASTTAQVASYGIPNDTASGDITRTTSNALRIAPYSITVATFAQGAPPRRRAVRR